MIQDNTKKNPHPTLKKENEKANEKKYSDS